MRGISDKQRTLPTIPLRGATRILGAASLRDTRFAIARAIISCIVTNTPTDPANETIREAFVDSYT